MKRKPLLGQVVATMLVINLAFPFSALAQSAGSEAMSQHAGVDSLGEIQSSIDVLKAQVDGLMGSTAAKGAAVNTAVKPTSTGPTINDRLVKIQQSILKRFGMNHKQAVAMSAKMNKTPVIENLKRPFNPQSMFTAVGAVATMNLFNQWRSGEKVTLSSTLGFLGDKNFWGGFMVSSVAYALASAGVMAIMPAGAMALAAVLPTIAGMAASLIGWKIGSSDKSIKEIFKELDFFDIAGRAIGSTAGIIIGGQLGYVIGGTLGSFLGPIGSIVGAMVLGNIGVRIASFIKGLFTGDPAAAAAASREATKIVKKEAPVLGTLVSVISPKAPSSSDKTAELYTRYKELYRAFIRAHHDNRAVEAALLLDELRSVKAAYQASTGN